MRLIPALLAALLLTSLPAISAGPDPALFEGLKARLVGPAAMSGRIAAIDVAPDDDTKILAGASTGGLWLSEDAGLTWEPVFDDGPVNSIGAVKFHPANPSIVWAGTGEGNTRNSTSVGRGIFKSLDGGRTWHHMGLAGTERINRIAVHPTNPDIAYVAALGTLWGENEERGLYKTTDGGKSWTKILSADRKTGATDIQMDPKNPNKLYASLWQFRRWPWRFESGGPGSGLYISHDAGESWRKLTEEDGLPEGPWGRSAFAVAKSDPSRVYALVEAKTSALIRSHDGGKTWQSVNSDPDINDRPFYYNDLVVDPNDPNRVYRVGSRVKLSIDGGQSFAYIPAINCCAASNTIHIDTHAYWINPQDSRHMIFGNDGGIAISRDKGTSFRFVRNLPLAQFYHIAVDDQTPYHIYGGLQDNGSWRGPAEVWENGGIRNLHWQEVAFGDGFDTLPDPERPNAGYAMSQGGNLYRWNLDEGVMRLIRPNPPEDGTELRFNWNAGLAQDPYDAGTIYYGSQFVHKSTDRGLSWQIISPDLTSDDPDRQTYKTSGGLTPDVTAAENHTTITAIAPSPITKGVIWVGTDDGRVHVTRDGGSSWTSLEARMEGMPQGAQVPMIDPSHHDAGVAYIVVDGHRVNDMAPYLYRADDYGARIKRVDTDAPVDGYALSVRQDPVDPDLLFLGTEFGLFVSMTAGKDWMKWTAGVPTASVMDMAIQTRESDLVLGTHGRGAFVIDDYRALRDLNAKDFQERFKLLSAGDGQQYDPNQTPSSRFTGMGEFRAENEPYGVMITFLASGEDLPHPDPEKEKARKQAARAKRGDKDEDASKAASDDPSEDDKASAEDKKLTVEIHDGDGSLIRTFKADVHQGINRVVWPMNRDGLTPPPPAKPREDGTMPGGMQVLPGTYRLVARFDGIEQEAEVRVLSDPRSSVPADDRAANQKARMGLQSYQAAAFDAVRRLDDAKRHVETVLTLLKNAPKPDPDAEDPHKALKEQASAAKKRIAELDALFRLPRDARGIQYDDDKILAKLGTASFHLGSSNAAPSQATRAYMEQGKQAVAEGVAKVNAFIEGELAALRDAVGQAPLGLLQVEPVSLP